MLIKIMFENMIKIMFENMIIMIKIMFENMMIIVIIMFENMMCSINGFLAKRIQFKYHVRRSLSVGFPKLWKTW